MGRKFSLSHERPLRLSVIIQQARALVAFLDRKKIFEREEKRKKLIIFVHFQSIFGLEIPSFVYLVGLFQERSRGKENEIRILCSFRFSDMVSVRCLATEIVEASRLV